MVINTEIWSAQEDLALVWVIGHINNKYGIGYTSANTRAMYILKLSNLISGSICYHVKHVSLYSLYRGISPFMHYWKRTVIRWATLHYSTYRAASLWSSLQQSNTAWLMVVNTHMQVSQLDYIFSHFYKTFLLIVLLQKNCSSFLRMLRQKGLSI